MLEKALKEQEEAVDGLLKSIKKYTTAVKAWKKACSLGHISNLHKSASLAVELCQALPQSTVDAAGVWDFDVRAYLDSDDWLNELQETTSSAVGLRTIRSNDTLISSPVIVRSQAARGILILGMSNWPAIRPAVVAAELKRLRDRTLGASSQEFLESLCAACMHLSTKQGDAIRLRDIYDVFCLTPGYKKDNPHAAFGQQIYGLQRSGLRITKAGKTVEFEGPSGNSKERDIFAVIGDEGQTIRYYGIYFR